MEAIDEVITDGIPAELFRAEELPTGEMYRLVFMPLGVS
jgi:hypothetical protein